MNVMSVITTSLITVHDIGSISNICTLRLFKWQM